MELPTIERQDTCQVALSLSLANDQASLPVYGCLGHRNGRAMTNVCARRRFLTTSPSRTNTRLRSIGYAGLRDWSAARRGADGGRLWQQQRAARPNYGAGSDYVAGIPSDTTVWSHRTGPLPPNVRLCSVRAEGYLV